MLGTSRGWGVLCDVGTYCVGGRGGGGEGGREVQGGEGEEVRCRGGWMGGRLGGRLVVAVGWWR